DVCSSDLKSVDGMLNGQDKENTSSSGVGVTGAGTAGPQKSGTFEILTKSDPLVSGSRLLFEDSLNYDTPGRMAKYWQTNSTGRVVEIGGAPGTLLLLTDHASYQLGSLLLLPKKFTLEFHLLTRGVKAGDLRNIDYGFSKNNSTRQHISGVSNETIVYTRL